MKNYSDITYRYLKVQKKRTILTLIGIILSTALITAIGTMFMSLREYEIQKTIHDTGDYHVQYSNIKGNLVPKIKNSIYASNTSILSETMYGIISEVSDKEKSVDKEIPPYRYLVFRQWDEKALSMFTIPLIEGRLPKAPKELLVDNWVLEYLPGSPKIGDKIKLPVGKLYAANSDNPIDKPEFNQNEIFKKTKELEFTIVGITEMRFNSSNKYVANGITFISNKNLHENENYDVYIKMNSLKNIEEKAQKIAKITGLKKQKSKNGSLKYPIEYNNKLLRLHAKSNNPVLNKGLIMSIIFVIVLVMICSSAVIYNAFNISVLERISQFGVLRCVGAAPKQIRNIVFKEASILSILGIPIGLFCGIFAMKIVMCIINSLDVANTNPILNKLEVDIFLPVIIGSTILALVTIYLSAMVPAKQAAKVSPLEAVRNTGNLKKEDFKKIKKSSLIQFILGIESQIAFKNLRRNRKRFYITIFSMTISIVMYIVFTSLVNYTFQSGYDGIDVDMDFIVSINEDSEMKSFTTKQYNQITNLPGVKNIEKNMNTDIVIKVPENKLNSKFASLKGELLKTKNNGLIIYKKSQIISYGESKNSYIQKFLKKDSLNTLNKENGVILLSTNQIYDPIKKKIVIVDVLDYKVGDEIQLSVNPPKSNLKDSNFKTVKIMGILNKNFFNSYNKNGDVNLITTEEVYKNITKNSNYSQIGITLVEGASHKPVINYLENLCKSNPNYAYVDISKITKTMKTATVILSIFLYGFVAVIALIGCLNIINTISTNLILRIREFSMLKAIGMTQNGIKKLVCMEGTLYGIISAVYGGIIGSVLSYVLFKIIEKTMIELKWFMPWKSIIVSTLGAVIIALLASIIPLKRVNKGSIIEHIRIEE